MYPDPKVPKVPNGPKAPNSVDNVKCRPPPSGPMDLPGLPALGVRARQGLTILIALQDGVQDS